MEPLVISVSYCILSQITLKRCEHGFICTLKSRLGVRYMLIWLSVSVLEVLKFPPLGFCNCNKFICTVCKANNR